MSEKQVNQWFFKFAVCLAAVALLAVCVLHDADSVLSSPVPALVLK
jgi:hypothetical protein